MKQLDKKQLPQIIALGVLTAGAGAYAAVHFAAPGPASAQTHPAAVASTPAPGAAVKPGDPKPGDPMPAAPEPGDAKFGAAVSAGTVAALDASVAPPPVPGMRDPFAVGYFDTAGPGAASGTHAPALPALMPGKQMAAVSKLSPMPIGPAAFSLPTAPALPSASRGQTLPGLPSGPSVPALPASITPVPAPPAWTVTGVLAGAGGKVAILRSGEARRIVRSGDFVDSTYRVAAVSRTAVILRHGILVYQIKLGGVKASPSVLPVSLPLSQPKPSAPIPAASKAILDSAIIPVCPVAWPAAPLVHLTKQGIAQRALLLAAEAPSVPRATPKPVVPVVSAAKVAQTISLGLHLLDGTVLTAHKD